MALRLFSLAGPVAVRSAGAIALALLTLPASASPKDAPPREVGMCVTCHGAQGVSQTPDAPNLAGQPEIYLREQLKAYRSGARKHEVMGVIAKGLSDADIQAAAAYYSTFEIEVKNR